MKLFAWVFSLFDISLILCFFITVNISNEDDLNTLHISLNDAKWSINLPKLKKEICVSNVVSCLKATNSFKSIALLFFATLWTMGPSIWDIGSDIGQGHQYLEGDVYTKIGKEHN